MCRCVGWAPPTKRYNTCMSKPFQAIFESGVLKPLQALSLAEHEVVTLIVANDHGDTTVATREGTPSPGLPDELLDHDLMAIAEQEADGEIPLEELRDRLSSIRGSMSDVIISERGEY